MLLSYYINETFGANIYPCQAIAASCIFTDCLVFNIYVCEVVLNSDLKTILKSSDSAQMLGHSDANTGPC